MCAHVHARRWYNADSDDVCASRSKTMLISQEYMKRFKADINKFVMSVHTVAWCERIETDCVSHVCMCLPFPM